MPVSVNVVIMTIDEFEEAKTKAFQRGVERGKFEASARNEQVSRNCANWSDGICNTCGAQWQGCEVGPDYKCPHFSRKARP